MSGEEVLHAPNAMIHGPIAGDVRAVDGGVREQHSRLTLASNASDDALQIDNHQITTRRLQMNDL